MNILKILDSVVDLYPQSRLDDTFGTFYSMLPPSSLWEKKGETMSLTVPVPGFDRDDLQVEVEEGYLKVKGNVLNSSDRYTSTKTFERSYSLPRGSDFNTLKCSYRAGVLLLEVLSGSGKAKSITIE